MNIELLIQEIVEEVKKVRGMRSIVLGGSRARGTHTPSSDVDLGIYYDPNHPFDLEALSGIATQLDDEKRADVITGTGGWGPWINGGGWLRVQSVPVDFLYRDLDKVSKIIEACLNGTVEIDYQPGHPFGFVSSIYLAEAAVCQPLWDPDGIIAELKSKVIPYPSAYQRAMIQKFAWEIDFSIGIAKKSIERADVVYASGCCFRSMMCMLQVLFALNGEYWLNEKGAVAIANGFVVKPVDFQNRANEIFKLLDTTPASIQASVGALKELSAEVTSLLPRS